MKNKILLSLKCLVLASGLSLASLASAELKTVPYVDVSKYLGTWYQIAHIPLFFEGGACACARQNLSADASGVVKVYNSCNTDNAAGALREIRGEAYNDDPKTNARFTVDFHLAYKGTYWIIGLDPQYRYAVVSDKDQYSLYILSKTPTLPAALYNEAVSIAAQQLDVSKLEMTDQRNCKYP